MVRREGISSLNVRIEKPGTVPFPFMELLRGREQDSAGQLRKFQSWVKEFESKEADANPKVAKKRHWKALEKMKVNVNGRPKIYGDVTAEDQMLMSASDFEVLLSTYIHRLSITESAA